MDTEAPAAPATFTRLKTGAWGVRAPSGTVAGQSLVVARRDGSTSTVTVGTVLWTGIARDGQPASLVSIAPVARTYDAQRFNGYGAARGGHRRACKTDGNCSSLGSGRSCGGHDCDGY